MIRNRTKLVKSRKVEFLFNSKVGKVLYVTNAHKHFLNLVFVHKRRSGAIGENKLLYHLMKRVVISIVKAKIGGNNIYGQVLSQLENSFFLITHISVLK